MNSVAAVHKKWTDIYAILQGQPQLKERATPSSKAASDYEMR